MLDLPGSMGPAIVSRVKILGGMNIVERRRAQDGQISTEIEGRAVDIRVSTTAVVGGEKVVLRLLDKSRPLFKLEQLGMPAVDGAALRQDAARALRHGDLRRPHRQRQDHHPPARMDIPAASDEAPVVRVVQMMIAQGVRDRASDIHIEPQNDRVRVRYRIDGALHDVLDLPGSMGPAIVSRVKILGGMNIVERRRAQDGQISTEIEGRGRRHPGRHHRGGGR